tara:strand:+ start:11475 stop:11588 length:114 start_codon:yes stop_codon:yes gene_type:complete
MRYGVLMPVEIDFDTLALRRIPNRSLLKIQGFAILSS